MFVHFSTVGWWETSLRRARKERKEMLDKVQGPMMWKWWIQLGRCRICRMYVIYFKDMYINKELCIYMLYGHPATSTQLIF